MTRDEMARLAAARPAGLDPTPNAERRARDLHNAMSNSPEGHQVTTKSHSMKRRLTISLAGVVAVGAAAAVAISTTGGGGGPAVHSPHNEGSDGTPTLLTAALKAERLPMGAYWYTNHINGQSYRVKAGYMVVGAHTETLRWTAVKASGGSEAHGRDLPARPLTAQDKAAWQKAGSPSTFQVTSNGVSRTYPTKASAWRTDPARDKGNRFSVPLIASMTLKQIESLPADPARLQKIFLRTRSMPRRTAAENAWFGDPAHVVVHAGWALGELPLSPKVRAGLMRALAAEKGVRRLGRVTDPLGRKGIAYGADWSGTRPAGRGRFEKLGFVTREELIFDAKTGEYLGDRQVLTKPGGLYRGWTPGSIISYDLVRGSGWTDKKPTPPSALPFP